MGRHERRGIVARGLLPVDFGESDVIRTLNEGDAVRRQRRLPDGNTFWTLELPITPPVKVISDRGERRTFDPDIIRRDIKSVYHKIPVDDEMLDEICSQIVYGVAKIGIEKGYVYTLDIKNESLKVLGKVSPLLGFRYLATFCPEVPDEIMFAEFERVFGIKPGPPIDEDYLEKIKSITPPPAQESQVLPEEPYKQGSTSDSLEQFHESVSFGEILRSIRKSRGLSLNELCQELKISPAYISRIENNHVSASLRIINDIAKILSYSLFDLLRAAGKIEIEGMGEEEIDKIKRLVDSGKVEVGKRSQKP